jgi:hypothetical protein
MMLQHDAIESEGRLLLPLRRQRFNAACARKLAEISREVGEALPSAPRATAAGDESRLRGLPLQFWAGKPIDGTMPGTQPERACLARRGLLE